MDDPVSTIHNILNEHAADSSLKSANVIAKETLPHLRTLIKEKGKDSETVKQVCTEIGRALLARAVKCVNAATQVYTSKTNKDDSDSHVYMNHLLAAQSIMEYISKLPATESFRDELLMPQKRKLALLIKRIGVHAETPPAQEPTTEIPTAKSPIGPAQITEIPSKRSRKGPLICCALAVILGVLYGAYRMRQNSALHNLEANYTEEAAMDFLLANHPEALTDQALDLYLSEMDSILLYSERLSQPTQYPALVRMDNFAKSAGLSERIRQAISQRVTIRTDSLYRLAREVDNLDAWYTYQNQAPSALYYDSSERIDSLESLAWSEEPSAWDVVQSGDTRDLYTRYLSRYPNGSHAGAATARLIDMEVGDYRNRGKNAIDSIDRIADYPIDAARGMSRVAIFNYSEYPLEFLFSGPTSKRMSIGPEGSEFCDLSDGEYRILVKIANAKDDRFSFTQKFHQGIYSSSLSMGKE